MENAKLDFLSIDGTWSAKLDVNGFKLTLVLEVVQNSEHHSATLECIEQKIKFPVDSIVQEGTIGNKLRFAIHGMAAEFSGVLNEEGSEISGVYQQGSSIPLTFRRGLYLSENRKPKPQDPKPPFPYQSIDVNYTNSLGGHTLAGTLMIPDSAKFSAPFPVVLFITGSGPHDRDETILGHKPFLVLADHLARSGIGTLRVDDRGVGQSTGRFEIATTEDFATDVIAGIQFLKNRTEFDSKQIGLIGHSEGGIIASMVAVQSEDVAFIVLLASSGVPGAEVVSKQAELLLRANGATEDKIAKDREVREECFKVLKTQPDYGKASEMIREILFKARLFKDVEIEAFIQQLNSPWFRFFLSYDPAVALRKVKIPVLALVGEKDLQTSPIQNIPAIELALKESGNPDYSLVEFPGLNHLLQTCEKGTVDEYAQIEETISKSVLETVSKWIQEHILSHCT